MPETLVKAFCATTELLKATETPEGDWLVSGPINPDKEDYDGDILTDGGVRKGLTFFRNLGRHVDYGHEYHKRKEPKWLIGKGADFDGPDGKPWLGTTLFKSKEIAKQLWEHLQSGGHAGYSMQGLLKARDSKDNRKIIDTEIHLITIDPSPKGYGNYLQIGMPAGSFASLSKSISAEMDAGDLREQGWTPESQWQEWQQSSVEELAKALADLRNEMQGFRKSLDPSYDPAHKEECCPHCGARLEQGDGICNRCGKPWPDKKALMTGAGVVGDGATGGAALRVQELHSPVEQTCCAECGTKNRLTRAKCRKCGKQMGVHKAVDALACKLALKGVPNAAQVAARIRALRA